MTELTVKPSTNGEAPLPRRTGPKGLLPSTWIERTVKVSYADSSGKSRDTSGKLLDLYPFGPVLSMNGTRVALSWDAVNLIELQSD
jgi:hypothetical protein